MITRDRNADMDKISLSEDEIIFNGPPAGLTGKITLQNTNKETARVRYLELTSSGNKKAKSISNVALYVNSKLRAGEIRQKEMTLTLPPDTPPGTYENSIMAGGKKRRVKMVVQPSVAIELTPESFTFQGTAPGTKHTATVTLTNTGNLPFQVPEVKHVAPLDMDMLCRALGYGFRKDKEEGFTETMDHVTRNLKENIPAWARAGVKQAGEILLPAMSMLVDITLTMPEDSKAENDYSLIVRFWDRSLTFLFKSHQDTGKTKKR